MILNQMQDLSKPQKKFFVILMQMFLSIQGKINFRNLARYSNLAERTFSRWFERCFNFAEFNTKAIQQLSTFKVCICAIDACFLEKAGKATYGIDRFWNGCASKAQKGLEISLSAIVNVSTKTAYPLQADQTPSMKDIKLLLGTEANRIDFYLSYIQSIKDYIKKFTTLMVFDGFYTKKKFVDGILAMGFTVIGKLRLDANLKKLYVGTPNKRRGRPKKFEGKCNAKELEGFEFASDIDDKTRIYTGVFYHSSLEREVRVVAITSTEGDQTPVALIFSTDKELSAHEIYSYYTARFQIEFTFRDAQQFTGLGDCQSRKKKAIHFHVNASFAAINIAKIQEQLTYANQDERMVFSMSSHKVRNHNETMISRFFSMFGLDLTLIKSKPLYEKALNYGTISSVRV